MFLSSSFYAMVLPLAGLALFGPLLPGLAAENLLAEESAEMGIVPFNVGGAIDVSIFDGDPVPADSGNPVSACYLVRLTRSTLGRAAATSLMRKIFVDPEKTYRLSVRIHSDAAVGLTIGGYAYGEDQPGQPIKTGKRVWQCSLKPPGNNSEGPFPEWIPFEAVVGPEASGATFTWPKHAIRISFTIWITGEEGAEIYVDGLTMEEVEEGG